MNQYEKDFVIQYSQSQYRAPEEFNNGSVSGLLGLLHRTGQALPPFPHKEVPDAQATGVYPLFKGHDSPWSKIPPYWWSGHFLSLGSRPWPISPELLVAESSCKGQSPASPHDSASKLIIEDDAPTSADSPSTILGTQTTPASSNTSFSSREGLSGNQSKDSKRTIIWSRAFKAPRVR